MADLRSRLRAGLRGVLPTPRRNPFALGYLALLLGTTLFARFGDQAVVDRLQGYSSSDAHNLLDHPIGSLLLSGTWVAGPVWMPYFWAFAVTVAPLERRVGGRRAAAVFAAGHVLATLLSQAVVLAAVAAGRLDAAALDGLDIGVSYGVLASLGALAGLFAPPGRLCALGGAAALIGRQLLDDTDLVTGIGHPVALLVGIALWPWLRRATPYVVTPGARGTARRGTARAATGSRAPI
ncbi:rhomboid-like protein [Kitasatospora sp. NPDC051853]|uniref:rhomboid-like protein n=1 Tax=Kitasatospora sp. NPDC051853 TaxID=3364058 RepID=UPI00379642BA